MSTKKTPLLLALALAAGTAPTPLGAQARPQAPIFPTGIEIINLSLSVTDAQNNFVTSLGEGDFAVFEDGIRQELSLFTHENLPISMVIMIDTSASMEEKLATAQAAARDARRRSAGFVFMASRRRSFRARRRTPPAPRRSARRAGSPGARR